MRFEPHSATPAGSRRGSRRCRRSRRAPSKHAVAADLEAGLDRQGDLFLCSS
jgi:hypothetical protein